MHLLIHLITINYYFILMDCKKIRHKRVKIKLNSVYYNLGIKK